jgi:hypothetical protein
VALDAFRRVSPGLLLGLVSAGPGHSIGRGSWPALPGPVRCAVALGLLLASDSAPAVHGVCATQCRPWLIGLNGCQPLHASLRRP